MSLPKKPKASQKSPQSEETLPIGVANLPSSGRARGNPAENREAATRRRKFIYEQLKERTRLTLDQLDRDIGKTTKTAIRDDIDFFRKHGIRFKLLEEERILVDEGVRYGDGGGFQGKLRVIEKKIVAKIAASLILGRRETDRSKDVSPLDACCTQEDFLTCLKSQHTKLGRVLTDYWRDTSRLVALDAGSSNEQIAALLTTLNLPDRRSNLSYLSVCTNSRSIFNQIGEPHVTIRAIITGGQQRGRTTTLAGAMTEFFLKRAALLQFGLSFIGATGIDVGIGHCITDSQEEMLVKQCFLQKTTARVIVADNGKLKKPLLRNGFSFASLTPEQIDLVITNSPLSMSTFMTSGESGNKPGKEQIEEHYVAIENFHSMISDLKSLNIPVLVGVSDITCPVEISEEAGKIRVHFTKGELSTLQIPY